MLFLRQMLGVAQSALLDWFAHRASSKGAALAFYAIFSLAPILLLVIALAGFFYGEQAAQGELLDQLRNLLGEQGAEAVQLVLAGARNPTSGLFATIIAGALLLFAATSVFAELKASLDDIWRAEAPAQSSHSTQLLFWELLSTRLLSFGLILLLAFFLSTSFIISAVLAFISHYLQDFWGELSRIVAWIMPCFSFALLALLFALVYKTLPRVRLSWADVGMGALGTAGLFSLGKFVIGIYLSRSAVASSFGAAGSLIALMLWIYYSAQIFFLGAAFTRQYALQIGSLRALKKIAVTKS